jgi:hypothetical protein
MSFLSQAKFEVVREIAFGAIGAAYGVVGTPLVNPVRIVRFVNETDEGVYISFDGVHNHIRLSTGSFFLLDIDSNRENLNSFALQKGTVFYIKAVGALPISGAFWIETVYAA